MTRLGLREVARELRPAELPGLSALWAQTQGDPRIVVAIIDGLVDQSHPALRGASLTRLPSLIHEDPAPDRPMCAHGTHVTSLIFGRASGGVRGIAPGCSGLLVPVFSDGQRGPVPQLDIARAIEQALDRGAHVINISGGQQVPPGGADPMLDRAVRRCERQGALIVAAAGNDGGRCLHAPAALPGTLAVGALGLDGRPLALSNWGDAYRRNGILAPGERVRGARAGGGTMLMTGTSFAAPLVSGIAALLLSLQLKLGRRPSPSAIRRALLGAAVAGGRDPGSDRGRSLAGVLNIDGARALVTKGEDTTMLEATPISAANLKADPGRATAGAVGVSPSAALDEHDDVEPSAARPACAEATPAAGAAPAGGAAPGCACSPSRQGLIFAIGTIGYDFGTEARRDTFRMLMEYDGQKPPNPFDPRKMVEYLKKKEAESTKLIWTLNLELTPIYALEAEVPYAEGVYTALRDALWGQNQPEADKSNFVARVSVPGTLTGRTVRLFSGQIVPVVVVQGRGLWAWNVDILMDSLRGAVDALLTKRKVPQEVRDLHLNEVVETTKQVLNRIYYDMRNLGQTSSDRALNYAVTNTFQLTQGLATSMTSDRGDQPKVLQLRDYSVEKSPYGRLDSDCWDVKLRFFDPDNVLRAMKVLRFTVDVSDVLPVPMGPIRFWEEAGAY